ncbi:MAG TPA: hypothetical protein VGA55_04465 [Bacteroidota bacterium]
MTQRPPLHPTLAVLVAVLAVTVPGAAVNDSAFPGSPQPPAQKEILVLKDFTEIEVKGSGFSLQKETRIHISALGGGDRVFWRDVFDNADESRMFAGAWIIDAVTRELVWEMTMDNTSGRSYQRSFDGDLDLKPGSYEVYYAAHGYYHSSTFSSSTINIDRRAGNRKDHWSGVNLFKKWFSDDRGDLIEDFMEYAKEYRITISAEDPEASQVRLFEAPLPMPHTVFKATRVGDHEFIKRAFDVQSPLTVLIYAVGEGRKRDEIFDYGWIVNSSTRERIWDMNDRSVRYAGGAAKNIRWHGELQLSKGTYELYFVTDDSHSDEDWNAKPPYDPFNYGVTISTLNESDRARISPTEFPDPAPNAIVSLTKVSDNEFVSTGFTLKSETKVRVYGIGESDHQYDLADFGWIVDAKNRERVWTMEGRKTQHAGGATKNRMVDEIITLPAGSYIAYYQTDGSHSYQEWNSDPPFDEEHYGLTISGTGERFDPRSVAKFTEGEEENVLAQLIRVRDDRHVSKRFTLEKPTKIRIYALGEGVDGEMADYGWMADVRSGRTVWEMTYGMTDRAGGARKNRVVSTSLILEKGEYELHYQTDDSHSYNDWNDDPPDDRMHWGITVYKEQ